MVRQRRTTHLEKKQAEGSDIYMIGMLNEAPNIHQQYNKIGQVIAHKSNNTQ
jgi:hypothetical protein